MIKNNYLTFFLLGLFFILSFIFISSYHITYLGIYKKGTMEYTNYYAAMNSLLNWQNFGIWKMGFTQCFNIIGFENGIYASKSQCDVFTSYPPYTMSLPYFIKNILNLDLTLKQIIDLILIFYYFFSCFFIFLIFYKVCKLLDINVNSSIVISILPFIYLYFNDWLLSNFINLWVPETSEFFFIVLFIYSRIILIERYTINRINFYLFTIFLGCLTSNFFYFVIIFDFIFSIILKDRFNFKIYFIIFLIAFFSKILHFATINPDVGFNSENKNFLDNIYIGGLYFVNRIITILWLQTDLSHSGHLYNFTIFDVYNRIIMNIYIKYFVTYSFLFSLIALVFLKNRTELKILSYTFIVPTICCFAFAYFAKMHHIAHDFMNMRYLIIAPASFVLFSVLILRILERYNKNNSKFIYYFFNFFILAIAGILLVKETKQIINFNFLI